MVKFYDDIIELLEIYTFLVFIFAIYIPKNITLDFIYKDYRTTECVVMQVNNNFKAVRFRSNHVRRSLK